MTTEDKIKFKELIDNQIQELSKEVAAIKKALYPERGEGPSDKVAHLNFKLDQSIHIQRYEEGTKRLNRLKNAYLKIDTPNYGICKECEEEISIDRLKLMPESIYCVACIQEMS